MFDGNFEFAYFAKESPVLLDPFLPNLTCFIFDYFKAFSKKMIDDGDTITDDEARIFLQFSRYMAKIMYVRGRKKMEKYFPHEVSDLRGVLAVIEFIKSSTAQESENLGLFNFKNYTRDQTPGYYRSGLRDAEMVFSAWLGALMRIPFSFEKIDPSFREKVQNYSLEYLFTNQSSRETAAWSLARYFSRSDSVVTVFVTEICDKMKTETEKLEAILEDSKAERPNGYVLMGGLKFLCDLYKIGDRGKIIKVNQQCFELANNTLEIFENVPDNLKDSNVEKMCIKLIGRIALTELKPRAAKWKYQRGNRVTIAVAKDDAAAGDAGIGGADDKDDHENDEIEIPEIVEEILGVLLNSLKHWATVVRWNGAKQLGRIIERMDKENGTHVTETVLEMMDSRESEDTWHGAASALAEFCRRNLIVQDLLPSAIDKMVEGLQFDKRRGDGSIGSNVRDASCYVAWTLARGFNPNHLKPHVTKIIRTLLLVSCFDREVSCRRAAQAALQENIGRLPLGFINNGLEINQAVNFNTIATLEKAGRMGARIAIDFSEYRDGVIDYLIEKRLCHWEMDVRLNSAAALKLISNKCQNDFNHSLPRIQKLLTIEGKQDMNKQHGYAYGLASIYSNIPQLGFHIEFKLVKRHLVIII